MGTAESARLEGVTPYTLRHSGVSWALAGGIPTSDVARFPGTSVTMLETTYHLLLETSADAARQLWTRSRSALAKRWPRSSHSTKAPENRAFLMMRPARFERATSASAGLRSIP